MAWLWVTLIIIFSLAALLAAVWLIFDLTSRLQSLRGGAPWVPLENEVAQAMWQMTDPQPGEVVVDLGCGDARHLIHAANRYQVTGVGYEVAIAPLLAARANVMRLGLRDRITIYGQDFRTVQLPPAQVVFLYLTPALLQTFASHSISQLAPGTRVVTARFPLPSEHIPTAVDTSQHHPIYLYNV